MLQNEKKIKTVTGKDVLIKKSKVIEDNEEIKPEKEAEEEEIEEEEEKSEDEECTVRYIQTEPSYNAYKSNYTYEKEENNREIAQQTFIEEKQSPIKNNDDNIVKRSVKPSSDIYVSNSPPREKQFSIPEQKTVKKDLENATDIVTLPIADTQTQNKVKSPQQKDKKKSRKRGGFLSGFIMIIVSIILVIVGIHKLQFITKKHRNYCFIYENIIAQILDDPITERKSFNTTIPEKCRDWIKKESKTVGVNDEGEFVLLKHTKSLLRSIIAFGKSSPLLCDLSFIWFIVFIALIVRLACMIRAYYILLPRARKIIAGGISNQCFISNVKTNLEKSGYSTFMCWGLLRSFLMNDKHIQYNELTGSEPFFSSAQ